jgi:hypothetical protein
MLNWFARLLLVSTALSPILGAVAVNQYTLKKPLSAWLPWVVISVFLVFICWALLRYVARSGQKHTIDIGQFEDKDKEVLAFLLAYLLPFAAAKDILAEVHWLTAAYVFGIILLVFTHARAVHFNPMMGLLRYHFYNVKDRDGVSMLLMSRRELRRAGLQIEAVRIAEDIYLDVGAPDV